MTREEWADVCGIKNDEMKEYLKRNWLAIEGQPKNKTTNGNAYLSIVSGGLKLEGDYPPAYYTTVDNAFQGWIESLNSIGKRQENSGCRAVVRTWPELQRHSFFSPDDWFMSQDKDNVPVLWLYTVYSRMVFE